MTYDIFDRYAEEYDAWFDTHPGEYEAELARIRKILPVPDNRTLDLGTGSGRFAVPLGIRLGLEPSLPLARMARGRGIEVIRGIAEQIPLKTGSCSALALITVLCYLEDPAAAFREMHRVLAAEGMLVIGFLEKGGEVARRTRDQPGKHRFLSRARFYPQGEVRELLGNSGFLIKQMDSRAGFCTVLARKET